MDQPKWRQEILKGESKENPFCNIKNVAKKPKERERRKNYCGEN